MAIFKRGRIYWYKFRWSVKTEDGKKESHLIRRSARTSAKRKAEGQEEDHRTALRRGEVHPLDPFPKVEAPVLKPMTLLEYSEVVLRHVALRAKPRTLDFYRQCLQRIEKFQRLADAPIGSVTADLIEAFVDWRRSARSGNTPWAINGELRTLRRILYYAEEKGQITKAPAIHMLPGCDGRDRVLTPQEEDAYLREAAGDLKDAAILDIETGLRPDSELFPLKWENVTDAGIRIIRGKTKAAVRTVPLSPRAKAVLEIRRSARQDDSPFVFPSKESASGHLMTLKKPHYRTCRQAKLKIFPIYTFRHTFGTRCAESGVDRYTLARWMGHSSPTITARYYVHVTEAHEAAGFEKFIQYCEKLRVDAFPQATLRVQ